DKVPDVFHAGHLHTFGYLIYRGIIVVNSGTWQGQTDYMRAMGMKPNPGKATIINLKSRRVEAVLDFTIESHIKFV
ncbi:MAG: hypothetical protein DRJ21_01810, partial [Candidatus Methanomethylicota archaeon]